MDKDLYPSLSASSAPEYSEADVPPPSYDQINSTQIGTSNLNQLNGTISSNNLNNSGQPIDNFQVIHYNVSEFNADEETLTDEREIVDSKHIPSPNLTKDEARRILLSYAQSKDSHISQKAVKRMEILNIDYSYVHAFCLETFTEKRSSVWEFTKYKGGRIDDQSLSPTGKMMTIWEFQPNHSEPTLFCDKTTDYVIPYSEYLQPCHRCSPNSTGYCFVCSGNNKLKYFLKCRIIHTNHRDEFYTKPSLIPSKLLSSASGDFVYTKQGLTVQPINYVQNVDISNASANLIHSHRNTFKAEKVIAQRCHIRIIPVMSVSFKYNEIISNYFIYGNDLRVHCPNFPVSTCTIM